MTTYQRNINQTVTPSKPMEVSLLEGRAITLNAAANAVGTITRYTTTGAFVEQLAISNAGPAIYGGQFSGAFVVSISCTAGSIDVTVTEAVVNVPQIVVSSAAPNNNDGRPDGTVYVQTA